MPPPNPKKSFLLGPQITNGLQTFHMENKSPIHGNTKIQTLVLKSSIIGWVAKYIPCMMEKENWPFLSSSFTQYGAKLSTPLIVKFGERSHSKGRPHDPWQEGWSCMMQYLNKTCKFDWPGRRAWISHLLMSAHIASFGEIRLKPPPLIYIFIKLSS